MTKVDLLGKGFPNNWDWDQDLAHDFRHGYLGDCDAGGNGSNSEPSLSNACKMDGFDRSYSGPNGSGSQTSHPTCTYTYQYVDPKSIQPYWDMAKQYVLADNAFQTQGSESFTAHQDLIAGGTAIEPSESVIDDPTNVPWGCDAPPGETTSLLTTKGKYLQDQGPFPCFTYETLRDLLDAAAISWKFYAVKVNGGSAGIWSAFDAIDAVRHSKEWGTNVVWPDTRIFDDIKSGHLPKRFVDNSGWLELRPSGRSEPQKRQGGRQRPVVGHLGRQRDRRKQVLEKQRDRRALGRLGRLLRPRAAAFLRRSGRPRFSISR